MEVKCPRCGQPAQFSPENPFRPFCSERCKLIDLGAWAEGKYAIPVEAIDEEEQTLAEIAGDDDDQDPRDDLH